MGILIEKKNLTTVCYLQGHDCEYDIDECAPMPCMNGGTCHDLINGFNCSCPKGTTGQLCEMNEQDCFTGACHHGGTCLDQV